MLGEDNLQAADEGVEGFRGIGLFRPEGIGNLAMRQFMLRREEEHREQMVLHGREMNGLALWIVEMLRSLIEAQSTEGRVCCRSSGWGVWER